MITIILATIGCLFAAVVLHEREDILKYTNPRLSLVYMWASSVGYGLTALGFILIFMRLWGAAT